MKRNGMKTLVNNLKQIRGRHTELVSIYIPAGFNLAKVLEQIRSEQSTAQNIKDKTVRKNVLGALEKILGKLKLYKTTPKNGLVVFCGNVSEKEGASDIKLWEIEPPEPIKTRLYRCDQAFVLGPLLEMFREREVYGLVVLDKSEADIGLLKGKDIEVLKHMESVVPGKTKAGGWSQARYQRVREGLLNDFLKKVGETASAQFKEIKELKGIIIGGPGPIKEQFVGEEFLTHDIKPKILGVVNTSYTGKYGLNELVDRAEDIISQASIIKEKKILDRFFNEFAKDTGLAVYGFSEVTEALKSGNIEVLLISEEFDWVRASFECQCGFKTEMELKKEQVQEQTCPKCGKKLDLLEEKDLTDEIINLAEKMGTRVEMISVQTPRGLQLKELGGIGGILRYKA